MKSEFASEARLLATALLGKRAFDSRTQHSSTNPDQLIEQSFPEMSCPAALASGGLSLSMYRARILVSSAITFLTALTADSPGRLLLTSSAVQSSEAAQCN